MSKTINGLDYFGVNDNGTNTEYICEIINIGDWNMNSSGSGTTNVNIAHNLSSTEWKTIRGIEVIIRNDADTQYLPIIGLLASSLYVAGNISINNTNIGLTAFQTAWFDSTDYNATSYNRGWIKFLYKPDA